MREKRNNIPFDTDEIEQADKINYVDDVSVHDVVSNKNTAIAAYKIRNKYKKMRAKRNNIRFDIDEIEQADTINYIDDVTLDDVKQNKNALITAKKNTVKCKKTSRKRKRDRSPEPIEGPIKKQSLGAQSKRSAVIAAKKDN